MEDLGSQDGSKMEKKSMQKSIKKLMHLGRFLEGFGRFLGAKMEPCWHPNRSKIDATCEKRFFEKSCSPCSGGLIFWVRGVQVGSITRLKIDQKRSSAWERILASIFERFLHILPFFFTHFTHVYTFSNVFL